MNEEPQQVTTQADRKVTNMARGTGHPLSEQKRRDMFAAWCEKAACRYVARKCGVSEATARRYRRNDSWDERLAEIRRQVDARDEETITEAKARQLRIVRRLQEEFEEKLVAAALQVKPTDAIAAMKHELLIRDEPTERKEITLVEQLEERHEAYLRRQRERERRRAELEREGEPHPDG